MVPPARGGEHEGQPLLQAGQQMTRDGGSCLASFRCLCAAPHWTARPLQKLLVISYQKLHNLTRGCGGVRPLAQSSHLKCWHMQGAQRHSVGLSRWPRGKATGGRSRSDALAHCWFLLQRINPSVKTWCPRKTPSGRSAARSPAYLWMMIVRDTPSFQDFLIKCVSDGRLTFCNAQEITALPASRIPEIVTHRTPYPARRSTITPPCPRSLPCHKNGK